MRSEENHIWTIEEIAFVKQRHDAGISYGQIARELGHGLTRNAVIGKVHRLGLDRRGHAFTPTQKFPKAPRAPRFWKPKRILAPFKFIKAKAEMEPETSPDPVTLMQLKPRHCRWPLGEPRDPDMLYCGATKIEGYSYCGRHCEAAYQPRRGVSALPQASIEA
jgi:GcrA cell cycle regulator